MRALAFQGDVSPALHYCFPKGGKAHKNCGCDCEHFTVFERDHIHREALNDALGQICGAKVTVIILVNEEPPVHLNEKAMSEPCADTSLNAKSEALTSAKS
jgi:hypothetical protein